MFGAWTKMLVQRHGNAHQALIPVGSTETVDQGWETAMLARALMLSPFDRGKIAETPKAEATL